MFFTQKTIMAASCILGLSAASMAHAQNMPVRIPTGTTFPAAPSGALPVTDPAHPASAPTEGAQLVGNVSGTSTTSTPGVLGEGGLPSIENTSTGNVAGLLSYCVHKNYASGTTPRSVARNLSKRPDVRNDQGYSLGGQGLLQNGTSKPFDIATLDLSKRVKLCSDLTKKGQSLTN
ncbi:DUF2501 domain-containing protein [Acetobacter pomorum]|uniref:DUF2501 domain-containing protein n=1 Tax=Acetobacter pomorum TaxID=65959 RepID=A0A2G4RG00_9PROT|nr:DUF2501 domain-containing protein [Acetobacter pomorum]PHY95502.1 DUF2501 domain-containing protein [Acetobacter pomorum]